MLYCSQFRGDTKDDSRNQKDQNERNESNRPSWQRWSDDRLPSNWQQVTLPRLYPFNASKDRRWLGISDHLPLQSRP